MAEQTAITWCNHTFNIVWGCKKISPGCTNCYAEELATRFGWDTWGNHKPRRTFPETYWEQLERWNRQAQKKKTRQSVFCGSMCDVFENHPTVQKERRKLWPLIRRTQHLNYLLLTKRPENISASLPKDWGKGYPNVWLGVSIENKDYTWRADTLRTIPATVRFVSAEPLLGPLSNIDLNGIHWVIVGGESGQNFRPMDHAWAAQLQKKCADKGVSFFFKQSSHRFPGRDTKLNGKTVREFPQNKPQRQALPLLT